MTLSLVLALLTAPGWLTSDTALAFGGERTAFGSATAAMAPAPDAPGQYSLRISFRLEKHGNDWLDVAWQPTLPIALGTTLPLEIRAEQPADWLHVKIVDADNPGANHALLEQPLKWQGKPLPAGEWLAADLPLAADPKRRDGIEYFGFYLPCANTAIPLQTELVFHVGRFAYVPPARPPWPPQASGAQALAPVALAPLNDSQAWQMPTPADNPSGKRAVTTAERVEFDVPSEGWNEFMHSNPQKLVLQPETTYRLQYDYTVLREASGGEGATFYQLVRTGAAPVREDVGWQNWTDPAGATGRRVVTFTTRAFPGYYLIFGVRHSGAIRLENIRLWRLPQSEG